MKTQLLLIIFQFAWAYAFCQIDSNSISILETILRKQHPNGTLFYTDRLDSELISSTKKSLKGRKFIGRINQATYDTIQLSKKEKKYLDSCLNKLSSNLWKDSLFENSKRIPKDSMWARVEKQNREFYKNNKVRDTTEAGVIKSIGRQVANANTFQFSPLIYFRNKSIFIVYFMRLCGSLCGVEELSFYRLENGNYKKWILVSGGVF